MIRPEGVIQWNSDRVAVFKRGEAWWYKFYFAGRLIRESAKSTSQTVAKEAEKQGKRDLEAGFNKITQAASNEFEP